MTVEIRLDSGTVSQALETVLRRDILELPEGTNFGTEEVLLARYSVSRPTLREALKVMGAEQLLEVRRGARGGYFVRRPDSTLVTRIAASYVGSLNSTPGQILTAFLPLRGQLARLACRCNDPSLRARLQEFADQDALTRAYSFSDFSRSERLLLALLGHMSQNPVLEMLQKIATSLAANRFGQEGFYNSSRERIEVARKIRRDLVASVLAHDEAGAVAACKQHVECQIRWLKEDGHEATALTD